MDEEAAHGQSAMIVRDQYDHDIWRVYFQARLMAPAFLNRSDAISYLGALKAGYKKPRPAKSHQGKEIRRETSNR